MSSQSRVWRALMLLALVALLLAPASAFAEGGGPGHGLFSPGLVSQAARFAANPAAPAARIAPQDAMLEVIATGLNNPRGIGMDPSGNLYVAEAGLSGDNCVEIDPENDPGFMVCTGDTGSITFLSLKRGVQKRAATGLPSLGTGYAPEETVIGTTGPHDISFHDKDNGYFTIGLGANPAMREFLGDGFGLLGKIPAASNQWHYKADISQHEADENPDGGEIDSNPYGVLALPGGMAVVADAGANALILVNVETGATETLAVFPNRVVPVDPVAQELFGLPPEMEAQAVPTAVTMCPDGNYYVSQLLGFPFTPGESYIWKVVPGEDPVPHVMGLTALVDITCDKDGNLYVVEMAKNGLIAAEIFGDFAGAVIKIAPDGTQTMIDPEGLMAPGGIVIGKDGALYVTNFSIFPGAATTDEPGGQVVRIVE